MTPQMTWPLLVSPTSSYYPLSWSVWLNPVDFPIVPTVNMYILCRVIVCLALSTYKGPPTFFCLLNTYEFLSSHH